MIQWFKEFEEFLKTLPTSTLCIFNESKWRGCSCCNCEPLPMPGYFMKIRSSLFLDGQFIICCFLMEVM